MNKREKQKEETLRDILKNSEKLFQERGYEKTTIQNIADSCGLSKGALYHHFKSKEEVLERICLQYYRFIQDTFQPIVSDPGMTMKEKLHRIMTIARNSQFNTAAVTFSKGRQEPVSSVDNAVMENLFEQYNEQIYRELFSPLFEEGRRRGECDFPGSADVLALFVHHLDIGMGRQLKRLLADPLNPDSEKAVTEVIDGFTFALAQLLHMEREVIAEITLAGKMRDQYRILLHDRKKDSLRRRNHE